MPKYALLVLVGFLWGSQYLFIKIALDRLDPLAIGFLRSAIGAAFMAVICLGIRRPGPGAPGDRSPWWLIAIIGLLETGLPSLLIAWGQQWLDSGLTAIVLGTTPLFTILLVRIGLREHRMNRGLIAAVAIGFVGLLVLLGARIHLEAPLRLLPVAAVLLAAVCFAASIVLLTTVRGRSAATLSRDLLAWSSLPLLALWMTLGSPSTLEVDTASALAIVFLATFGGGLVFLLYILLIRLAGPTFASLSNYLVPLVGVALGITIGREQLLISDLFALVIILGALSCTGNRRRGGPADSVAHDSDGIGPRT